jgi:hypothetical protein
VRLRYAIAAAILPVVAASGWAASASAGALDASSTALRAAAAQTDLLEAENLSLPAQLGGRRADRTASAGASLIVWSTGTATGSFSTTAPRTMMLRARGEACAGWPRMRVLVDATEVVRTTVSSPVWVSLRPSSVIPAGSHRIAVSFLNDHRETACDRNLYLDAVSFGTPPSTTTPRPTVSPTATATATPRSTVSPTPTATPSPAGTVLFDADVARRGLSAYASSQNAQRITVVDDPVLGAARKVLKFTVHESDNQLTGNPRAQVETAQVFREGQDIYVGWSAYYPGDWPAALPSGGWITQAEIYGPPYAGGAPVRIGAQNGTTRPALVLTNGATVPWRSTATAGDGGPRRGIWYDFVLRERLSRNAADAVVELWLNTGQGWQKQQLSGQETLHVPTVTSANGQGANYSALKLYYAAGMHLPNPLTVYYADHRVATSFAAAAPRSYGPS